MHPAHTAWCRHLTKPRGKAHVGVVASRQSLPNRLILRVRFTERVLSLSPNGGTEHLILDRQRLRQIGIDVCIERNEPINYAASAG